MKIGLRTAILWWLSLCLICMGCGRQADSQRRTYGYSNGPNGKRSLNGFGALREMYSQRGDKTFTAISFSRALETMDTIVWTPDTVTPPSLVNRDKIEQWLSSKSGRTLVYIGRDFDASIDYWEHVVEQLPAGKKSRALREQMLSRVQSMECDLGGVHFARWFVVDTTLPRSRVQGLRGEWAEGIDVRQTDLVTRTELRPAEDWDQEKRNLTPLIGGLEGQPMPVWQDSAERWTVEEIDSVQDEETSKIPNTKLLLTADDGRPLAFELTSSAWGGSRIIVLVNGSFTLNGALVVKEHRKLAARVVQQSLEKGRVAFLRTGRNGVRVSNNNDSPYSSGGLEMFAYWPINLIVYHFFILGIVLCFVVFPIFGRPRALPPRELSDFGYHIEAVGGMLRKCRDEEFAREKISDYFRLVRKEPKHPWCQKDESKPPWSQKDFFK